MSNPVWTAQWCETCTLEDACALHHAAPLLLEALEAVSRDAYTLDDQHGIRIHTDTLVTIRHAIRVARGSDHGPGHNVDRTNVENRQHSCPDSSGPIKGS